MNIWKPVQGEPAGVRPASLRDRRCIVIAIEGPTAVVKMTGWVGQPVFRIPTKDLVEPYTPKGKT